jgi:DNA-binding MarR family transcriptional regulator
MLDARLMHDAHLEADVRPGGPRRRDGKIAVAVSATRRWATVEEPTRRVEYENMLLGRYQHLSQSKGRRKDSTLERSAYILLSRIRVEGPMSISELSDAFGLDASTLRRQTAAALRAGLVEYALDPEGGVARKFRITEEGGRRLDEEREGNVRSLALVLEGWSEEDIAGFADYLQRFNTSIERLHGKAWPRP